MVYCCIVVLLYYCIVGRVGGGGVGWDLFATKISPIPQTKKQNKTKR